MLNADDILLLLEELPKVLALNPSHEGARALLNEARKRAQPRAALLLQALKRARKPSDYKERLGKILKLDPDGPSGDQARTLLKDL